MSTHARPGDRGFTLIELTLSIATSAIIMLTVTSLLGLTQREWAKGLERTELTFETALALDDLAALVRSTGADSVTVSVEGDTVTFAGGRRVYADSTHSLRLQSPTKTFPYLEGMVVGFAASKPVIRAPGDTLQDAVQLSLALQHKHVAKTTSVILYPRAK